MRFHPQILVLPTLLLVAAPPAAWGAGESAGIVLAAQPEDVVRRVLGGEVVLLESRDDAYVRAILGFERPIENVAGLLRQVGRQREFRSAVKESSTLAVFEGGALERQQMRYAFFEIVAHLRYTFEEAGHRIRWALDEHYQNDLRRAEGYWQLYEMGDRTLAHFGSLVDVGAPAPRFIQRSATRTDLLRVQRWVNSGGTWRP